MHPPFSAWGFQREGVTDASPSGQTFRLGWEHRTSQIRGKGSIFSEKSLKNLSKAKVGIQTALNGVWFIIGSAEGFGFVTAEF